MKLNRLFKYYWVFVITEKIRFVIFNAKSSCFDNGFPKKNWGFHKIRTSKNFPVHGIRLITKNWTMEIVWN